MFRRIFIFLLVVAAVLAAGWLALRRDDIPYDSLEAKYTTPASRFLTLESGLKVHYRIDGPKDAPVLVMVHGFASSFVTWDDWAEDLSKTYRVVRFDLPGHGLTRVLATTDLSTDGFTNFVNQMADALQIKSFVLIGSSMGGNTAWNYAVTHADRLDGLVLVAASGLPEKNEDDEPPLVFKLIRNPITGPMMVDLDITPFIRDGLKKSFVDQALVTDEMVDRYVELARAPGHRKALLELATRRETDIDVKMEKMKSVNVPVLILFGEQDHVVPPSFGEVYASYFPQSKLVMYDNVGHLPQEEIPARSLEDLTAFLTGDVFTTSPE